MRHFLMVARSADQFARRSLPQATPGCHHLQVFDKQWLETGVNVGDEADQEQNQLKEDRVTMTKSKYLAALVRGSYPLSLPCDAILNT